MGPEGVGREDAGLGGAGGIRGLMEAPQTRANCSSPCRAIGYMMLSILYPLVTFVLLIICVAYWGMTALYPSTLLSPPNQGPNPCLPNPPRFGSDQGCHRGWEQAHIRDL